ncbi:MAG: hypothetical protein WKF84_29695 [Pyrinomonadaceae bacterium]
MPDIFEFIEDMFEFMPDMFEFIEDMFEFMPDMFEFIEDMFEFMVLLPLVPPLMFEFIEDMFEFVVFVLSAGVQPTTNTVIVSNAISAKYRRIEFPPDPLKRFMISELPQSPVSLT